jgi:hypothetical protein
MNRGRALPGLRRGYVFGTRCKRRSRQLHRVQLRVVVGVRTRSPRRATLIGVRLLSLVLGGVAAEGPRPRAWQTSRTSAPAKRSRGRSKPRTAGTSS